MNISPHHQGRIQGGGDGGGRPPLGPAGPQKRARQGPLGRPLWGLARDNLGSAGPKSGRACSEGFVRVFFRGWAPGALPGHKQVRNWALRPTFGQSEGNLEPGRAPKAERPVQKDMLEPSSLRKGPYGPAGPQTGPLSGPKVPLLS